MSNFLRQSTASQSRSLGPFVSDSDGKTVQTGLTIANTDIKLVVNGGASANKNSGGGTHRVNGVYGVTFDATDTATVGEMEVSVLVTGALVVFKTFYVLEEAAFDALFAASADPAAAVWAYVIDGTRTAVQLFRGLAAAAMGKSSGLDTGAVKYRDIADTKDVISATADANGNRSAVTVTLT